jgi:ribosomal-protein-alanine N-acetyltransferase
MSTSKVQKEQQLRVQIRWMIRRDMPEVLQIESESFDHAWTEEDFLRCLRQRNCIGMVAEQAEKVIGFMIYELHKSKLHIMNFAVAPEHRRLGIGSQMVSKLIGKLSSHRRTKITLAVRESNLYAQLFFRVQDFRAAKVLRGYYPDSGEDAYLMQFKIDSDSGFEVEEPENRIAQYEEN